MRRAKFTGKYKIGDMVELAYYGKQLDYNSGQRDCVGIIVSINEDSHSPYEIEWIGMKPVRGRGRLYPMNEREIKLVRTPKTKKVKK